MTGDAGFSTVEAALAIASLVSVLLLCLAGATALSMQVRCIDAAREVARLAARGDSMAVGVAGGLAPPGAAVELRDSGGYVVARVTDRASILPGVVISGEAVAAREPVR
ncbi:MAG: TadE family type IV pilus minor pilin [Mycobacterium sp.]